MSTVLVAAGAAVRVFLVLCDTIKLLNAQPEIVTTFSSFENVHEAMFLQSNGHSPYEGEYFHRMPLILDMFNLIPSQWYPFVFILVDCISAMILFSTCSIMMSRSGGEENNPFERQMISKVKINSVTGANQWGYIDYLGTFDVNPQDAPSLVAVAFLFNPFILLCCGVMNLNSLAFVLGIFALNRTLSSGDYVTSALAFSLAVYLDIHYIFLILPLSFQLLQDRSTKALFFILLTTAFYSLLLLKSCEDIRTCTYQGYFKVMQLEDLSPNIGLWWYFFIEMFPQFSKMFLFLFLLAPLVYMLPLASSLYDRPMFLGHVMLIIIHTQGPYPDFFGVGLLSSLIFMHPYAVKRMSLLVPAMLICVGTCFLLPVMRTMWLHAGSGNANYYYFQTLFLQFCISFLTLQFIRGGMLRNIYIDVFKKALGAPKKAQ